MIILIICFGVWGLLMLGYSAALSITGGKWE
jgi:hypothetical protein